MRKERLLTLSSILIILAVLLPVFSLSAQKGPVRTLSKAEWNRILQGGNRIGPDKAPVTIVEFADFQCPDCRMFAMVLDQYRNNHPGQLKVIVHNFPLRQHPQAVLAAEAANCVAKSGNFAMYYSLLFDNQDRFYTEPWDSLARLAGVKDTASLNGCMKTDSNKDTIRRDMQLGINIGLMETPTIIIDRVLYSGALTYDQLTDAVKYAIQSGS